MKSKTWCSVALALFLPLSMWAGQHATNKVGMVENAVRVSNVAPVSGFFGDRMRLNREV